MITDDGDEKIEMEFKRREETTTMTDAPFNASEVASLAACGFTIDGSAARADGAMTVEALPHGAFHFRLVVTLPGGAQFSGFVPRSKITPSTDNVR